MRPSSSQLLATATVVAVLVGQAAAKTDLKGCVSSKTIAYGGASLIWYVPDTGEICAMLDCGGGRAPPKTTVPGCAAYKGTATYSPSYLPGFGAAQVAPASTPPSDPTSSPTGPVAETTKTDIAPAPTTSTGSLSLEESTGSCSGSASGPDSAESATAIATATEGSASDVTLSSSDLVATITQAPTTTGSTTEAGSASGSVSTASESSHGAESSAHHASASESSSVAEAAAAPTAAARGAFGVMVGLVAGAVVM
ncbi:hypothetical protein F4779DRAFT_545807 [Xylariaceae sp. FL0662B]|nr:hypothetical protein F4779DRAFT_545807 [Xylariaceae sp. FL0662B]